VDVLAVCCGRRARISEANRWVKFQVFAAASVVHHLTFPGSSFVSARVIRLPCPNYIDVTALDQ